MFATLLAWLYITFLCWTWGVLFFQLANKTTGNKIILPHISIICITGLSIITIIAGILSLFIPLGQWWVQFVFIIPVLLAFFIKDIPYFFSHFKKEFSLLHIVSLIFLSSLLFLIIVMSSWKIVHPDTLGYHAQTMQWIEKYKAVPGLVHLHVRFGYQGLWFADCALFDFSFIGKQGITFLNSTVLFWFLIFIINRIDHNFFKEGKKLYGFLWIGLLSLSLWSYTQVGLTATSASPDFIATIFVLTIIYLLLEKEVKHLPVTDWLLVSLLSIVAVTIKLSVAPLLLIAITAGSLFLIKRKFKFFFVLFMIGLLSFGGFFSRNIITSGYLIFPSTLLDIADVDWKYSKELTVLEKDYITAYAKKPGINHNEEIESVNKSSITQWLPDWWNNKPLQDKSILIIFLISIIASLIFFKRIFSSGFIPLVVIITMLSGVIFWFINAPDPRFGFGFILGFIGVVADLLFKEREISVGKNLRIAILLCFSIVIIAYTSYRFINFFQPDQLLTPLGIPAAEYSTFDCNGIKINSPINGEFGETPVPATDLNCEKFEPRGNTIEDGFKARSNP